MLRNGLFIALVAASLTACGTTTTERTASGAGIGAATGAAVGTVTGGSGTTGALIGGAAGAAAGGLTDEDDINLSE
ncbi:YMGG-like glycine zipper-containing protein [Phytohalomonas tamaricis]|uniref:YMGG-like glycine zipper-containing protein n=1 Tax=Phytohalomonas tamaricis TaxID=2081032 RepID=UPI000D0BCE5F|nr:YMGG-like glycine zipper-containing protein [Phytohalomonas tamaricis]